MIQSSELFQKCSHCVIYGINDICSYHYVLENLKKISPSDLKYHRKTTIEYSNKDIVLSMSDVHIEVDFELLGVNEYSLFFEIFRHISENIVLNRENIYVVCLHFDHIKKELMDVFYSFLNESKLKFVFIVKNICYVHANILKRCEVKKCKSAEKAWISTLHHSRIENMIPHIIHENKWSFFQWREKLYELLILNYNIHDCFAFMIERLVEENYLNQNNIDIFFKKYADIMEKYNNNYRTIYHLERFIVFVRNLKNKKQETNI